MTHRINTANPSAIDVAARELTAERLKTLREIGLVLYHEANGKLWFMCRSYYDELAAAGHDRGRRATVIRAAPQPAGHPAGFVVGVSELLRSQFLQRLPVGQWD